MRQLVLGIILMTGFIPYASAAQLDTMILFEDQITEPYFEFLRVVYIEYPEGGEIAQLLQGKNDSISFNVDNKTTQEFVTMINQNLESIPSNAVATDVKVKYQAILQGNPNSAVIEYKIQMIPTITNHVFYEGQKSTVDASWRGISIDKPIIFQTNYGEIDINNPRTALDVMIPHVSEKLDSVEILSLPLVDASGIKELPITSWHFLFDPTAILPSVTDYKGENVISHYSMGECTIIIGVCDDREWIEEIKLDKKYTIRMIESRDDAVIALEGYSESTMIGGFEVFQTSLKSIGTSHIIAEENNSLVMTMYGMAAIGVIGAIGIFVISNKKQKNDKNEGQTGIDPTHLRAYSTSYSAGGYKTNRGESYLISSKKSKMPI